MDISPLIGDLVMGEASGFSVGYFAKKFFKVMIFVIGGYTASLIYLSSRGFLTVNWSIVASSTEGIFSKISSLQLSVGVLGAGAMGGFLLGWKSG